MAVSTAGSNPADTWMMLTETGEHELPPDPATEEDKSRELEAEQRETTQGAQIALPQDLYASHFCEDGPPAQILGDPRPATPKNTPERVPTPPLPNQVPEQPEPLETEAPPVGREKNCWESFLAWICCKRKME